MNNLNALVTCGMDISKDKIDIVTLPGEHHEVIKNHPRAIATWINGVLKQHPLLQVVLEPTGGYEQQAVLSLLKKDIKTFIVHPNQVFHFAKARGMDAKTDKISAKALALYGQQETRSMTCVKADYPLKQTLKSLRSRLEQVKDTLQAERCRLGHEEVHKAVKQSIKRSIKALVQNQDILEKAIDEIIQEEDSLKHRFDLFQTFKGIGRTVARTLVLGLPELGERLPTQLARLVGVAPMNNDSGKKQGVRSIKGGRFHVRKSLYMAALVASQHNPELRAYYQGLLKRGKLKKVALVAVMNKMLKQLNAMVRDNKPWRNCNELAAHNA